MAEQPHFVARKYQEALRHSARPFVCPLCKDEASFATESKLFDHATAQHTMIVIESREDLVWRDFVAQAKSQVQVYVCKFFLSQSTWEMPIRLFESREYGARWDPLIRITEVKTEEVAGRLRMLPQEYPSIPRTSL